jgi:hypothetical protein
MNDDAPCVQRMVDRLSLVGGLPLLFRQGGGSVPRVRLVGLLT